jgi:molecular chaperone GrpE (heat shock protein)
MSRNPPTKPQPPPGQLPRAEGDWLQVLVRLLDHVYALHQAALRSRQPSLIDQLAQFQNACRDTARRVGLTPFVAAPAEPFDQQRHQLMDADAKPEAGAVVEETLATGYTFQGQLVRPALVRLSNGKESEAAQDQPV